MNIIESRKIALEAVRNLESQIRNTDIARLIDQVVEMQDGTEETFNDGMYMVNTKAKSVTIDEIKRFLAMNKAYEETLTNEQRESRRAKYNPFINVFVNRLENADAKIENVSVGKLF